MKKLLAILMALALMLTMLTVMAGCGDDEKKDDNDDENITQNVDDDDDDKKDDEKEDEEPEEEEDDIVGTWQCVDATITIDGETYSAYDYVIAFGGSEADAEEFEDAIDSLSFKFKSNGTFVEQSVDGEETGEYELDGNEITISEDNGETQNDTYKFKVKGDKLTLTQEMDEDGTEIAIKYTFKRD